MWTILSKLSFLRKHGLSIGLVVIVGIGLLSVWHMDRQLTKVTSEVEVISEKYTNLQEKHIALANEYTKFQEQVTIDLKQQSKIRDRITTLEKNFSEETKQLRETLTESADGSERDYRALMDKRPNILENIFNRGTQGVADEFQSISRD